MQKLTSHSPQLLAGILFTSGALVMIYELVGTRVVAPYLGASTYIWTSIIGVVLASLSLGYWWGGKWADQSPTLGKLTPVFGGAAVLVGATGWLSDLLQHLIPFVRFSVELKAVLCAIILFAPAATLLGIISPYITRLHLQSMDTAGRQLGKMAAFSTIGSIVGTFLAGFILIPLLGTERLLLFIASLLLGLTLVCGIAGKRLLMAVVVFITFFVVAFTRQTLLAQSPAIDVDTAYSRIAITHSTDEATSKEVIRLSTGFEEAQSALFVDSEEYVFAYTRLMDVFSLIQPAPKKVLVLGGAGYTIPRHLLQWPSQPEVTVVEIDPGMTALARKYFRLTDDARLNIRHEDARTFLTQSTETYDVIMVDVFSAAYGIPFHILTEESMVEFRRRLSPNGVMVTNVIGAPQGRHELLVGSVIKTFQTQFLTVAILAVYPTETTLLQNVIVVAANVPFDLKKLEASPYGHYRLSQLPLSGRVLTDDYSPMEAMVRSQWD